MRQPKIKLQPCPHCGSAKAPMFWCSSEALPEDCECEDAGNGESFAAVCDASKPNGRGGCGASSGFKPTVHEAAAAWNLRA